MDAKGTHVLTLNIVHEEAKDAIVLIQLDPFGLIMNDVLEAECVAEHVPLEALKQEHLSAPEHAPPACIRRVARIYKTLLQLGPVREPCDRLKGSLELVSHLLQ